MILVLDGFRKVKSDNLLNSSWWEFRHPQFLRGEPQLLSEIKRAVHYGEPSSNQDVAELKSQMFSLQHRISEMTESISELSFMVNNMMLNEVVTEETFDAKKRKVRSKLHGSFAEDDTHGPRNFLMTGPQIGAALFRPTNEDMQMEDEGDFVWDDNTLGDLLALEEPQTLVTSSKELPTATAVENAMSLAAEPFPSQSVQDLSQLIGSLSPEMQSRFVDRLAETLGKHLSEIVSAANSTNPSTSQTSVEPTTLKAIPTETPAIALPLASAALGAFVATVSAKSSLVSLARRNSPLHIHRDTKISQKLIQQAS